MPGKLSLSPSWMLDMESSWRAKPPTSPLPPGSNLDVLPRMPLWGVPQGQEVTQHRVRATPPPLFRVQGPQGGGTTPNSQGGKCCRSPARSRLPGLWPSLPTPQPQVPPSSGSLICLSCPPSSHPGSPGMKAGPVALAIFSAMLPGQAWETQGQRGPDLCAGAEIQTQPGLPPTLRAFLAALTLTGVSEERTLLPRVSTVADRGTGPPTECEVHE